jgi:hypothetical protein
MTLVKVLIASAVMAATVLATVLGMSLLMPGNSTVILTLRLFTAIAAGLLAVAASAKVLRIPEFDALLRDIRQRFAARGNR